jgi:hypothetical protein
MAIENFVMCPDSKQRAARARRRSVSVSHSAQGPSFVTDLFDLIGFVALVDSHNHFFVKNDFFAHLALGNQVIGLALN